MTTTAPSVDLVGQSTAPARAGATARPRRGQPKDNKTAYLMLTPMLILLTIFVLIPFVNAAYVSFYDWSFYLESEFVGLRNYVIVATDPEFLASVWRGLRFSLMTVPTGLVLAFVFANVVRGLGGKLASIVKTSIYIPTIISGVIAAIIFTLIYDYAGGILNWLLEIILSPFMEFQAIPWLGDPSLALPALAVPAVWIGFGITALIMLAGILDIPDSYYESAQLEGANWWQQMIHITLPMLKNVILFLLITGFVASVQQFELPLVMTKGGPLNSTMLPNLYIFDQFVNSERQGPPIAAALLLFIVLGAISAIIFRVLNSEKSMEG